MFVDDSEAYTLIYLYDENGTPIGYRYRKLSYASDVFDTYFFEKNLQGDIVAVYNSNGTKLVSYTYDAWGNVTTTYSNGGASTAAQYNPFRYRGYYYDTETGWYYLQSRYYNPTWGRFINADGQLNGGLLGYNQFAYCENNPVNMVDPNGRAWWHWALGAAIVAACAVATVITAGGFAAAAGAVAAVGSGVAAATTASTVAAGAFIGAASVYGMAVVTASLTSNSIEEFNSQGSWGTVEATAIGAFLGGAYSYVSSKKFTSSQAITKPKATSTVKNEVIDLPRTGSALKTDPYHAFPDIVDNYAGYATKSTLSNGTLYQLEGSLNGVNGRFEWIVQDQQITHRMFVKGGTINGIPIMP